jgi:hypothetical protein
MVCRRAEERIAELAGERVVLYIAVGKYGHKRLPFKHIQSPPEHVSVTISFESHEPGAALAPPAITRDEWGDGRKSLRLATNGGLPLADNGEFYKNGSLMRLLDTVITRGAGAAVLLFAESVEFAAASTPAVFRYIHLAQAIYSRMRDNEWSTVLDGKRGAHLRALMLFGAPVEDTGSMAFDMMFPTRYGCQRTYIRNLGDLKLSENFSRLWFYAACDANADPRVARCRQLAGKDESGTEATTEPATKPATESAAESATANLRDDGQGEASVPKQPKRVRRRKKTTPRAEASQ